MKRSHTILLTVLALLVVVPLVLMMWPEGPLDLSKDEEPFRSMVFPLKKVVCEVNESQQSDVRVLTTDGAGRNFQFWFHLRFDDPWTSYPSCNWVEYGPGIGFVEVKDCTRARAIISRLIKNSENRDKESVTALENLSKRPPDTWRRIRNKVERFLRGGGSGEKDCPF